MIAKVVSRVFLAFFIILFSQLPVFVDQYEIRLQGHVAESLRQIQAFQTAAAMSGKTLPQYISKFAEQADPDFKSQGKLMEDAVERNLSLTRASEALKVANLFIRPVVFIRYVDTQVLADAWKSFTPGLSFDLNMALWAGTGFLFGWLLLMALKGVFGPESVKKV